MSVGLFVYQAEDRIRGVIDSLLAQTYAQFELIISDNASTDATETICREYAARDARIRYLRQSSNLGATRNLRIVFDAARGKYFTWAAADDMKSPDFLSANVAALESDPTLVASTSPNCFEGEESSPQLLVRFEVRGNLFDRLNAFLDNCWTSHALFYSLMRRAALADYSALGEPFIAADWSVDVHLLFKGNIGRVSEGRLVSGRAGLSNEKDHYRKFARKWIEHLLPLYEFAKRTSKLVLSSRELSSAQKGALLKRLAKLNLNTGYSVYRSRRASSEPHLARNPIASKSLKTK